MTMGTNTALRYSKYCAFHQGRALIGGDCKCTRLQRLSQLVECISNRILLPAVVVSCCCCTDNPDRIKLARSNLDFVLSPSLMLVVGLTINSIPVVGPPRQWNTRAKRHLRSKNWSRCRYISNLTMGNVSQAAFRSRLVTGQGLGDLR